MTEMLDNFLFRQGVNGRVKDSLRVAEAIASELRLLNGFLGLDRNGGENGGHVKVLYCVLVVNGV